MGGGSMMYIEIYYIYEGVPQMLCLDPCSYILGGWMGRGVVA